METFASLTDLQIFEIFLAEVGAFLVWDMCLKKYFDE